MSVILIFLDKYSDWLETYSLLKENESSLSKVDVYLVNNDRNDEASVRDVYVDILGHNASKLTIVSHDSKPHLFKELEKASKQLSEGDFLVAPFIRYSDLWKLCGGSAKFTTVHISECFPDTFGHINYRLAFRGRKLKSWITLPLAKIYALIHKPDRCYFPFYPAIKNPFVAKTLPVVVPPLMESKLIALKSLFNGETRPIILGGFGYDVKNMATACNITKYVATSKGLEIIIDGKVYPLTERICAEEVLLSGLVSELIGYNSSAVVWAKLIYPEMQIKCYIAPEFNKKYGFLFNKLSIKALKKIGVSALPEEKEMLTS